MHDNDDLLLYTLTSMSPKRIVTFLNLPMKINPPKYFQKIFEINELVRYTSCALMIQCTMGRCEIYSGTWQQKIQALFEKKKMTKTFFGWRL